MVDSPEALQHKLGPLAAWQWGALAGGAILVYRVVSSQGHQSTGAGTVTLTPNNQPSVADSGLDTAPGLLNAMSANGLFPTHFSFTLPDGTVLSWDGTRMVTTPAGDGSGGGGGGGDGGGPSLGGQGSPWFLPMPRPGGPVIPGVTPNPLPTGRAGVSPYPIAVLPMPPGWVAPVWNPPTRPGGPASGGTPNPLPARPTGPATVVIPVRPPGPPVGTTPGALPGTRER
jgi:hypothetical protein